jgi:hypothetical protein
MVEFALRDAIVGSFSDVGFGESGRRARIVSTRQQRGPRWIRRKASTCRLGNGFTTGRRGADAEWCSYRLGVEVFYDETKQQSVLELRIPSCTKQRWSKQPKPRPERPASQECSGKRGGKEVVA